jgi:glycosyltransferase involved in cell wall biosynthesis
MPNVDEPVVSVLMPIFNGERFLPEAIRSLQNQTLRAWELVAVLDGCTDSSQAVLSERQDPRIQIVSLPARRGIGHALNQGLAACRSELVARFDADDVCMPTRLEAQVAALLKRPSVGALGTPAILIDENSKPIGLRAVHSGVRRIRIGMLIRNQLIHPTVMFRRSLVIKAGGYHERVPVAQDYELWLRLLSLAEIDNLSDPLIAYRLHPGQITLEPTTTDQTRQVLAESRRRAVGNMGVPTFLAGPLSAIWLAAQARRRLTLFTHALFKHASLGRFRD